MLNSLPPRAVSCPSFNTRRVPHEVERAIVHQRCGICRKLILDERIARIAERWAAVAAVVRIPQAGG